jgi:hypothetical protein
MSNDPLIGFRFRVTHPEGRIETLLVDAERALIGSAAHCEVRLPPEAAAHEHIEVYAHSGAIYFATRPYGLSARLPTLQGATAIEGRWDKGAVLALGDVQMSVDLIELGPPKARPPYWALLGLVPAVALIVVAGALARVSAPTDPPIPEAPLLLPPKEPIACPNVSAEQRSTLAAEKLRIGLAKRERSPFSPQDGLEAVVFLETAAGCYRASGMTNDAAQVDRAADVLRDKLDEDYRLRRVRLEHAYHVHDVPAVKREVLALIPLTSQRRGPYVEWLKALDRVATAELDKKSALHP